MKPLSTLIVIFFLTSAAANALAETGADDEIRERLKAFGQVCRSEQPCVGHSSQTPVSSHGSHWETIDSADSNEGQVSARGAQSRWVATAIGWPETAASIAIAPDTSAILRFTHLDLANGENSRYGPWENHWVTLKVGEREQDFVARKPADGRKLLRLGRGPGGFLAQAVQDNIGETLHVELHFRGHGQTVFSIPLRGAANALHQIGLVDNPGETASDSATDDRLLATVETATPPAPPRSGEAIYNAYCFACHATAVAEAPLFGSLDQWQPRIDKGMDTLVVTSLAGFDLMPPMGTCIDCTDNEMRNAIQYMIDNAR